MALAIINRLTESAANIAAEPLGDSALLLSTRPTACQSAQLRLEINRGHARRWYPSICTTRVDQHRKNLRWRPNADFGKVTCPTQYEDNSGKSTM